MQETVYALMFIALYFVPTIFAASGRRASVFIINLFFGWTFIGWVVALFMAIRSREVAEAKNV